MLRLNNLLKYDLINYEEKLEGLKKLFDKGLITKEEYDGKRKEIIDENF